jgi:hypothetical protein
MQGPDPATFLSGEHGHVAGRRGGLRRAADRVLDAGLALTAQSGVDDLAQRIPPRDVLIASVTPDPDGGPLAELRRSRHATRCVTGPAGHRGKFQNLNELLAGRPPAAWLLLVDDDVSLPAGFLDRFIALCEVFELDLAQPAQTLASHAAWRFARRRPFSLVRETNFVEIGPVTAFSRRAAAELLPFPDLRWGWGLDAHWAALAATHGWRMGIVDAVPVKHETRPVATGYVTAEATAEAQQFLADRPYVGSADAGHTSKTHRRVPR